MHAERGVRPGGRRGRAVTALLALAVVAALVACEPAPPPVVPTVGCDQAAVRVQVTASVQLDPTCTYTAGFDITASGTTLDCKGAHIVAPDPTVGGIGVLIVAPADVALSHVVVRNCTIQGFLNNLRVSRQGFKALAAGSEYDHPFSDIVIEDSHLSGARGTGLYVDGYVTGVTLQRLDIGGSGGAGIYLEAGSKGSVVRANQIHGNGFAGTDDSTFTFAGKLIHYHARGREGIAVDGSRENLITDNVIDGNAAGGVFLYKNCGEYVHQRPTEWWTRRYGADSNLVAGNTISTGRVGVWVGSRVSENLTFMDCSDPVVLTKPYTKVYADHAAGTIVYGNTFHAVSWGVRVEDDRTVVARNTFTGHDQAAEPGGAAVAIGGVYRTSTTAGQVDSIVAGTTVLENHTDAPAAALPYRYAYGLPAADVSGNTAADTPAGDAVPLAAGTVFAPDIFFTVASISPG